MVIIALFLASSLGERSAQAECLADAKAGVLATPIEMKQQTGADRRGRPCIEGMSDFAQEPVHAFMAHGMAVIARGLHQTGPTSVRSAASAATRRGCQRIASCPPFERHKIRLTLP